MITYLSYIFIKPSTLLYRPNLSAASLPTLWLGWREGESLRRIAPRCQNFCFASSRGNPRSRPFHLLLMLDIGAERIHCFAILVDVHWAASQFAPFKPSARRDFFYQNSKLSLWSCCVSSPPLYMKQSNWTTAEANLFRNELLWHRAVWKFEHLWFLQTSDGTSCSKELLRIQLFNWKWKGRCV